MEKQYFVVNRKKVVTDVKNINECFLEQFFCLFVVNFIFEYISGLPLIALECIKLRFDILL